MRTGIILSGPYAQTLNQYLQTLAGAASKRTSLQSTMANNNIAGLYKQQQTDDRFKVGSPSGSVYWTAGQQLPSPSQAQGLQSARLWLCVYPCMCKDLYKHRQTPDKAVS